MWARPGSGVFLTPTCHWPGLSHVASPNHKGGWDMTCDCEPRCTGRLAVVSEPVAASATHSSQHLCAPWKPCSHFGEGYDLCLSDPVLLHLSLRVCYSWDGVLSPPTSLGAPCKQMILLTQLFAGSSAAPGTFAVVQRVALATGIGISL